jgi:hypothetical protein
VPVFAGENGTSGQDEDTMIIRTGCHCLTDCKVPQFIAVSAAPLPRNPNGKVLKGPLRHRDFGAPLSG